MVPIGIEDEIEFAAGRPRTKMLHDSAGFRAVLFCLEKGQEVPGHTSPSEVMMQVYQGSGTVTVGGKEHAVKAGDVLISRPDETHGFRSEGGRMVVLALIVPSPA